MSATYLWHDYETWGINPSLDKPSQFASVRTDLDFNIVGDPINILCKPALDCVPSVQACLVTGINPMDNLQQGLNEAEFFKTIHEEMSVPGTCSVGYNSFRFDDEVTRYGFYRNFFDPYRREWANGNSRWDLIDTVRLCGLVRPEGIHWPLDEENYKAYRLEDLTKENNLAHENAHDALSDVYATINIAKLLRQKQPDMFDYALKFREKQFATAAISVGSLKPKLHISSMFGKANSLASVVLPLMTHPVNKNEVIAVDLRASPQALLDLSADEIHLKLYQSKSESSNEEKLPIKNIHINRSPIVLSPGLIDERVASEMRIDLAQCERHRQMIIGDKSSLDSLRKRLYEVFSRPYAADGEKDVEQMLYDGFFSNQVQAQRLSIPSLPVGELSSVSLDADQRLPELLFRYRARNHFSTLSNQEKENWLGYCRHKLLGAGGRIETCRLEVQEARQAQKEVKALLNGIEEYLDYLVEQLA